MRVVPFADQLWSWISKLAPRTANVHRLLDRGWTVQLNCYIDGACCEVAVLPADLLEAVAQLRIELLMEIMSVDPGGEAVRKRPGVRSR